MTHVRTLLYTILGILIVYALLRWLTDVSWGNQWVWIAGFATFMFALMRIK